MRRMVGPLVLLALPAALSSVARADALDDDHALSMELATPHTDWAQPYARGPVRALFFADGRGTGPREIIELMQRFEVEADAVYHISIVDTPDFEWLGGDAGHRRMLRLLQKPYDVFIFQGVTPTMLTAEEQYKLLRPVTEGAGLVLIGADDGRLLKASNKLERSAFLPPQAQAYTMGQGRGVRMPARPNLEYDVGWEVQYDYWQERLGRAVLWAAGREPEMELEVQIEPRQMARGTLPSLRVGARSAGLRPPKLEGVLRRWDGAAMWRGPLSWEAPSHAEDELMDQVASLRAGGYSLDVRALSKRGVEAWATAPFTVTSERTVQQVALDSDWGEIGQEVSGVARLTGPSVPDERLRVRLMDRRGRILVQQDFAQPPGETRFEFAIQPWMPMLLRVEAVVMQGDEEVSSASAFLRVTKRHRGQFNFLMWDCPRGTLAAYGEESLARLGTTIHLAHGNPPLQVAAYDMAWVPYTTRILDPKDERGHMQPVCWNDEPAVDEWVRGIVGPQEASREHGVFVYSLGDETVTRGSCLHPACLKAYQTYLREQYGGIARLNESWGTGFGSFDEVTLSSPQDNDEAESRREGHYARWYDRQAFQCANFVRLCTRFGGAFAKLDPEARTGFEGAGRFTDGDDIDLIVRTNGFWSPYPGMADEVVRSIAPRGFPRANWMGYTKDADSLLSKYWRMVTRGMDSVWWWRWDGLGQFNGFLAPHLGPFPATKDLAQDTQVVRDGLGTLLIESEMLDDGIAMLYSMPSAYATRVEGGPSYGGYEANHTAWQAAIRDLRLQFRYVTDRMLRQGEFEAQRYKALILPQTEAIGREEAEVIRRFVEGGGLVIADVRPGLFDGHCKPLPKGFLDDLFGIERGGNAQAVTAPARMEAEGVALQIAQATVDPVVRAAGAEALGSAGEAPVCLVREVGRGRAVLLNVAMTSFPKLRGPQSPEAAADLLARLLAQAGVEAQVKLTDAQGARLRNIEAVRWRNGEIELLALFRESGEPEPARVELPAARYVYDLRHHRALGKAKWFTTDIIPCRATFFALLPEAAPRPRLALSATARRGQVVTAELGVPGAAGQHALRVRARTPDGQAAEWWEQVVIVGREPVQVVLPVAYNDPRGRWQISVLDLYTDKPTTAELLVR